MMIGERNHHTPTVHVPSWAFADDPLSGGPFPVSPNGDANFNANFNGDDYSFFLQTDDLTALRRFLPSNDADGDSDDEGSGRECDINLDAYSCDQFRMFDFKVKKCTRGRSHDWTECPFAHPGEKARRRDPRKFHYSGTACPDFRKGNCRKGDECEFAHGVFECWLHPARYRTQPCKDGPNCRRRVCFFAHTPNQLRVLSPRTPLVSVDSYDGSPRRLALEGCVGKRLPFLSSPETISSPSDSPPMSPMGNSLNRSLGSTSINEMVASMRQLQLNKVKSMPSNSWGVQMGGGGGCSSGFGSPRLSLARSGFNSLPTTPTRALNRTGMGHLDMWDKGCLAEEEPVMERVESGRDLRARMFEKLSKENPLDRVDPNPRDAPNPDVDWVSELFN